MDKQVAALWLHALQRAMSLTHGPQPTMLHQDQIAEILGELEQDHITSHLNGQQVLAIAKAACAVLGPVCQVVNGLEASAVELEAGKLAKLIEDAKDALQAPAGDGKAAPKAKAKKSKESDAPESESEAKEEPQA